MKCEICHKEAAIFTRPNGNTYSETFYTNKEGQMVCKDCLGHTPKTLQQLNQERKELRDKLPVKVIPYRTQSQSRKYNKELNRIKKFGY